ncbi:MAG: MFS transporter [Desulfobulbus propionicus]|nr:MAG: MFS transporter [Desulfobulbus propionicus]
MSSQETNQYPNQSFQLTKVVLLSFCHFVHDVYTSFLAPLLPLLIEKLSLSLTQAGLLTSVMQIPALLNPYLGTLVDKVSTRYFIILAPGITAISMSLIGVAPTYSWLILLFIIAGVSTSIFHVPAPVLIYHYAGQRKGLGMSFFMTGGELARTVGPLIAVGAVAMMGLEGMYPVMLVGVAVSIFLYFRLKDIPKPKKSKQPPSMKAAWTESKHILKPLTSILLLRGFMHGSVAAFLPTFINQTTGNLWLAGISLTIYESAGVLGALTCGPLSDTFGRRNLLLFSLICAPPFLFLFIILHTTWLQLAALFCVGFTLLSTTPVMLALVQEHATKNPATANGFYMMLSFLARSAVVVIIGVIADYIGLKYTYALSAALGLCAVPIVLTLPKETQKVS